MIRRAWETWVALWDLREHPRSMALIRISLALVILWDLFTVLRLGLVPALMGIVEAGGVSVNLNTQHPAEWVLWMPQDPATAWVMWGGMVAAAALLAVGWLTRPAILVFVLLSAQWELMLPAASRGIESLVRIVLLILLFSACDRWASVSAWWRTGSIWGDGEDVPAWPRHLVILQLVVMYTGAGVQKFGLAWGPHGHFSALYLILQDPTLANADYGWVAAQPWYLLTQVGTAVTMAWEWTTPVLLLIYWYRFTAERPGRLRALSNRLRLEWWWAAIGIVFHLGIAATLELGIFPSAMLACYFCFLHPDDLARR